MGVIYRITSGLDLALVHGAFVDCAWSIEEDFATLHSIDTLYAWSSGVSFKSDVMKWHKYAVDIAELIRTLEPRGTEIGIDYSKNIAHWGNRVQASAVSYVLGIITGLLRRPAGWFVQPVTPVRVRHQFGLKGNVKKEVVIERMKSELMPEHKNLIEGYVYHNFKDKPPKIQNQAIEDLYDSVILSRALAIREII